LQEGNRYLAKNILKGARKMETKQIYDLIIVLRKVAKEREGDDRILMLGAANFLELLVRRCIDLEERIVGIGRDE
jgi:hypothetical protein